jgi:hypothetical protein
MPAFLSSQYDSVAIFNINKNNKPTYALLL